MAITQRAAILPAEENAAQPLEVVVIHTTLAGTREALRDAQSLRPDKSIVLSAADMESLNGWIEEQLAIWRGEKK